MERGEENQQQQQRFLSASLQILPFDSAGFPGRFIQTHLISSSSFHSPGSDGSSIYFFPFRVDFWCAELHCARPYSPRDVSINMKSKHTHKQEQRPIECSIIKPPVRSVLDIQPLYGVYITAHKKLFGDSSRQNTPSWNKKGYLSWDDLFKTLGDIHQEMNIRNEMTQVHIYTQ